MAILLGLTLAVVVQFRVFLYQLVSPATLPYLKIGLAVSIALSLQVISSTLIGSILPLIAAKFKVDPAVVASPALTTIVDITGLLIFFSTAKIILGI